MQSQFVTFNGAGIIVNGGSVTIDNRLEFYKLSFNNASTAGTATIENEGRLEFNDNSTAGSATINNGESLNFNDSSTAGSAIITGGAIFRDSSTADSATINDGAGFVGNSTAGSAIINYTRGGTFRGFASAGNATLTIDGGGVEFLQDSTADNAIIINNNRQLIFSDNSTAGQAQIVTNADPDEGVIGVTGTDFSFTSGPLGDNRLSAGSLAGNGNYFLGGNELTIGGNNFSTEVSGIIQDGGFNGGVGGGLIKVGTGTFTLSGDNIYTGATIVDQGRLIVNGSIISATTVNNNGVLGGSGTVASVTLAGGTLAPGESIGTLTIIGGLAFDAGSVFEVELDDQGNSDRVIVNGSVALGGSTLSLLEAGGFEGSDPFNYIVIANDAADAVSGTFGSITNQFAFLTPSVNYAGGDGNDVSLTLTPNDERPIDGCEIDGRDVVCSGLLPDGADTGDYGSRDSFNALLVTNVTGPITAANADGVAIDFINNNAPVSIRVDSPGTLITSEAAIFPRPPFRLDSAQAVGIRARTTGDITIFNDADISIINPILQPGGESTADLAAGIVAEPVPGAEIFPSVSIENLGNITMAGGVYDDNTYASTGAGIFVGISAAAGFNPFPSALPVTMVDVVNRGTIDVRGMEGIFVHRVVEGTINVTNEGTIRSASTEDKTITDSISVSNFGLQATVTIVNNGEIFMSSYDGGSSYGLHADSSRDLFVAEPGVEETLGSVTMINTGTITTENIDTSFYQVGIDGSLFGLPDFTSPLVIENSGTIRNAGLGITADTNGDRTIRNSGTIAIDRDGEAPVGVWFQYHAARLSEFDLYNPRGKISLFENSGTVSVSATRGDPFGFRATAVTYFGGDPHIVNTGLISATAPQGAGIWIEAIGQTDITEIGDFLLENSGRIIALGEGSGGVILENVYFDESDVATTTIISSGEIIGSGIDADGISLSHAALTRLSSMRERRRSHYPKARKCAAAPGRAPESGWSAARRRASPMRVILDQRTLLRLSQAAARRRFLIAALSKARSRWVAATTSSPFLPGGTFTGCWTAAMARTCLRWTAKAERVPFSIPVSSR
ncbi:MAG: hypothetical protein COA41_10285 [Sphingopyxis sp.]|nr:MAG: hypothetical protein COA41_10285 [Sphingopyxis sp.]